MASSSPISSIRSNVDKKKTPPRSPGANYPSASYIPEPPTVQLPDLVKAEVQQILFDIRLQPMMTAMNNQRNQLQDQQQFAVAAASNLIVELKQTIHECRNAQELPYRQLVIHQTQLADMKAEQQVRDGEMRAFASNVESEFAQNDQVSQQQQQHLSNQYQQSLKQWAEYGEDDRGRRRLVKEEPSHQVYSPPIRRQTMPVFNPEPPSSSAHGGVNMTDAPNPKGAGFMGMGVETATRYIPNAKIAPIPVFSAGRFSAPKKEIQFWKQLHCFIPEEQLVAFICFQGGPIPRSDAMQLYREFPNVAAPRAFNSFLNLLAAQYALSSHELEMKSIDKLFELNRDAGGSIQDFWAKFDTIFQDLALASSCLSGGLLFPRAMRSLNSTSAQRALLIAMMGSTGRAHSLVNLRAASIQLFGM